MAKLYGEILIEGNLKINPMKLFSNLTVDEEVMITRELINFCIWSRKNIDSINNFLKSKNIQLFSESLEVNCQVLTEFWLQTLSKPDSVEQLLTNFEVTTDSYTYISRYYNKVTSLQLEEDFIMVSKPIYRTKEQQQILHRILESRYKEELLNIFQRYKRDEDHVDKKYAQKIIDYFKKKKR